uniref:Uncharacterized protein n=1 Tax=Anguilla anguilla TaxID=7936 RepID=A0A0E9P8Z0_ANGAN
MLLNRLWNRVSISFITFSLTYLTQCRFDSLSFAFALEFFVIFQMVSLSDQVSRPIRNQLLHHNL